MSDLLRDLRYALRGFAKYLVGQGRREIGIRMALGATEGDVLSLVLRQGLAVALSGAAIGLLAALALSRFMRSLLFGVRAFDPLTFAAVALLLTSIALVASYVPARRAALRPDVVAEDRVAYSPDDTSGRALCSRSLVRSWPAMRRARVWNGSTHSCDKRAGTSTISH